MKNSYILIVAYCVLFLGIFRISSAQYVKLLDFTDTVGYYPKGSLINSNDTLFGAMQWGKSGNYQGSIFRIRMDGTGFKIINDFKGTDGINPQGSMVIKNKTLFGSTSEGGDQYKGNIFQIGTNGNNFKSIFSFHDTLGEKPISPLLIHGDTIFGVTSYGGKYNQGVLFRMLTDGTQFKKLRDFSVPPTPVILYNDFLYGVLTDNYSGHSIIYRIRTNGSEYLIIKELLVNPGAKPIPESPLVVAKSKLYGGACAGNSYSNIYKINADGSGYEVVYDFPSYNIFLPTNSLTYWNDSFIGGCGNQIFKVTDDGKGDILYRLTNLEGDYLNSSLLLNNDCLYGIATSGGKQGYGVIYKYNLISEIPSKQAEKIKVSELLCNQMKITWKRGNGSHCAVFLNSENSTEFPILNSVHYNAASQFGKGSQINNSGWYCVYNGNDTMVTVTGTQPTIKYQIKIVEYNVATLNDEKYNVQTSSGNPLTIQSPKCEQSIFFDVLPISTFGDPPFDPEGYSTSGLKVSYNSSNTSIATIQSGMVTIKNPGIATITATQEGNGLYASAAPVVRQFTVEKALLKVTATDTFRMEGAPNPNFRLKYNGFINGENEKMLLTKPILTCAATKDSPSGKYEIVVSGGIDNHYSFSYYNGILKVNLKTGINSSLKNIFSIYPNPVHDHLYFEGDDFMGTYFQIIDARGKVLIQAKYDGKLIDVSGLPLGFYILKTNYFTFKFVKN